MMAEALPSDDEGPLSQDTAHCLCDAAAPKVRSRKRKAAEPAPEQRLVHASVLPPLPDDVDGDLPLDLLGELALDGPLQGPGGRPAREIRGSHRRNVPKFPGRSIQDIMKELEMVPSRHPPLWDLPAATPIPAPLDGHLRDDLVEIYSPPRMVPIAAARGMRATLSVDLQTGWNLLDPDARAALVQEIKRRRPVVLMMSPPCTWFSGLMNLNWTKIKPVVREQAFRDATLHLEFCMLLADLQESAGRRWVLEHPDAAKSWQNNKVKATLERGAKIARFDQCMFGLVSKVDRIPMRKRTRFLTNMPEVLEMFHKKFCDQSHEHVTIQGSEGGEKRSVWAQRYPDYMCDRAVGAFLSHSLEFACRLPGL